MASILVGIFSLLQKVFCSGEDNNNNNNNNNQHQNQNQGGQYPGQQQYGNVRPLNDPP
jgi:hypothetical protein